MKNFIKIILIAIAFTFTTANAANVIVPNSFVSGTPAVANDVNTNFTVLQNAINANDTAIINNFSIINTHNTNIISNVSLISTNVVDIRTNVAAITATNDNVNTATLRINVNQNTIASNTNAISTNTSNIDANAFNIGINTTAADNNTSAIQSLQNTAPVALRAVDGNGNVAGLVVSANSTTLSILTDKGYLRPAVNLGTGKDINKTSIFFTTANCDGTAYVNSGNGTIFTVRTYASSSSNTTRYYVPKLATIQSISIMSTQANLESCVPLTADVMYFPAYVNDSAVTGVSGIIVTPITMELR